MQHDRHSDRVCACCARPAIGIGVAPSQIKSVNQILWLCDDEECIRIGQATMGVKQLEFSRIDGMATVVDAAQAIETYCDRIGKSDLREMSQAEFDEMCRRAIAAYRDALQNRLRNEAPF
ncbi:hypothetical protein [Devosia riboflavina]